MVGKNLEHNTKTKISDLTPDSGARQEEGIYFVTLRGLRVEMWYKWTVKNSRQAVVRGW